VEFILRISSTPGLRFKTEIIKDERVKEMRVPLEQRIREYRIIFDLLNEKPRIQYTEIAEELDVEIRTASSRLREAIEDGYIAGPQIRKKSFSNFKTYVYLVNSSNSLQSFREYIKDSHVLYHEIMEGFCNVRVVSDMKLDIDGTILGGVSSDYYVSYPPDQPWKASIDNMWNMVRKFNPRDYTPKGYITTHWDEIAEWSEQDEILFLEFKYDLRKPLEPLVKKKYHIWSGDGIEFLERLPKYCTISTSYFPLTMNAYDPFLYVFETDYEDFIIDLFSQLPTTCWFQRVSNTLICHVWTLREPVKKVTAHLENIPGIQIPLLVETLVNKGIVKKENRARKEYYWRKELDDI
jgi:predicted transcriptional regulator